MTDDCGAVAMVSVETEDSLTNTQKAKHVPEKEDFSGCKFQE